MFDRDRALGLAERPLEDAAYYEVYSTDAGKSGHVFNLFFDDESNACQQSQSRILRKSCSEAQVDRYSPMSCGLG